MTALFSTKNGHTDRKFDFNLILKIRKDHPEYLSDIFSKKETPDSVPFQNNRTESRIINVTENNDFLSREYDEGAENEQ